MPQPTIAAGFASALLDYASARGVDRATLLGASGLDKADLGSQDARVPLEAYHALIATAIRETGDTALLLRHTLASKLETMSIVGQIVLDETFDRPAQPLCAAYGGCRHHEGHRPVRNVGPGR